MAKVTVGMGYTVNLGNFENVRFDISVEDEPRGEETVAHTYDRCLSFVRSRLDTLVTEARSHAR